MDNLQCTSDKILCGDNGANAKTAPVTIVANTGKPIDYPGYGTIIFDLDSYTVKPKIPIDFDHDECESIGYLNRFEIVNGELVCKGALVPFLPDDDISEVIYQIQQGVPYQSSVESHKYDLEYVPQDVTATVNNQEVVGPLFICRNWSLDAVAICKFGKDDDTSVAIAASKNNKNNQELRKVVFHKNTNEGDMEKLINIKNSKVVEASGAIEPIAETKIEKVETEAKAVEVVETPIDAEVKSEVKTEVVVAEEAKPAEVVSEEVEVKEEVAIAASIDPRAEFKEFVAQFGKEKATDYYSSGLSLAQAQSEYLTAMRKENEELKNRLAIVSKSNNVSPVAFENREKAVENKPLINIRK